MAVLAGRSRRSLSATSTKGCNARSQSAGCLVTERPPGFEPRAQDFPRRNRLVSGLSLRRAGGRGGAQVGHTDDGALCARAGARVFAVPGHPLDPTRRGHQSSRSKAAPRCVTRVRRYSLEVLGPMTTLRAARLHRERRVRCVTHRRLQRLSGPAGPCRRTATAPRCSTCWARIRRTSTTWCARQALPCATVRIILMELDLAGRIERHGQHLVSRIETADGQP